MKRVTLVLMIASILKCLGCSPKSERAKNQSQSEKTELENKITKSNESFVTQTIYKNLTTAIIDSIPDDHLLEVIFDNLSDKIPRDYRKEYEYITTQFNSSQQAIYISWWFDAEVNNGGLNQYYANPSGQYAKMLPQLLQKMNAIKLVELTERANSIYKSNHKQITEDQDGTIAGFSKSYENNPLNDLDAEYYDLYEEEYLYKKQIEFIRANKDDFVN